MDNQTHKYSAFFKLYGDENLQVSFNIVENDLSQHLLNLEDILGLLKAQGYSVDPKQAAEGEEIREVTGWVLGKTKKDELCAHLYGPEHLQWKMVTVWQEDLDKLAVKIPATLQPIIGSAPDRETAVRLKILQPFPVGTKVILEPYLDFDGNVRLTDKGNPVKKFSRMYGSAKTKPEDTAKDKPDPKTTKTAKGGTQAVQPPLPEENFYQDQEESGEIDSYPDVIKVLTPGTEVKKFVDWCRKTQRSYAKKIAPSVELDRLVNGLDDSLKSPGAGDSLLSVLSGIDVLDLGEQISKSLVTKLSEWLLEAVVDENGEIHENPSYSPKYVEIVGELHSTIQKLWVDPVA